MTTANIIHVMCPCGKKLKAPATAAGKKARCPACGNTLVIAPGEGLADAPAMPPPIARSKPPAATPPPMPKPAQSAPPAIGIPEEEQDNSLDAMYTLAEQARTVPEPTAVGSCPQCKSPLAAGAVLCVNCGYDVRTGRKTAVATAPARAVASGRTAKKAAKRSATALMGPLLAGTIFSAIAALVASGLWIIVAAATGYAVGFIAIAIGVAAGIGMVAGNKDTSPIGGLIAAVTTILAILFAKVVVAEIILARVAPGVSLFDLPSDKLAEYFFSPMGLAMIAIGVLAAFKTGSGISGR